MKIEETRYVEMSVASILILLLIGMVFMWCSGCVTMPAEGVVTNKVHYDAWTETQMVNESGVWKQEETYHQDRYYVMINGKDGYNSLTVNKSQYMQATIGQYWILEGP